ncbi:MAG: alanine--tRNA ligase [Planctomycetota bacterium]
MSVTRTAAQVRQEFIDFFRGKQHAFVPSSPVVPHDDPTLLFTNAGMNQFKPYFLGTETPKHRRVANTQKCIRAGGKHNDLDDVGHDTYHHTFFEMLGNWSFGDYFKKEAIAWAWELLTGVWGIDKSRLHATYFGGDATEGLEPDIEARDLWASVTDIDPTHIHPGNKKDNFWEMGDTGPCGPCSEIHIDLTSDKTGGRLVNAGDARVIEIWNLVFIQFNRGPDGKLTPLPAKHVDTGMGFERVTAVLQGHNNNYATEVFVPVIEHLERISGHRYGEQGTGNRERGAGNGEQATGNREHATGNGEQGVAAGLRTDRLNPPPFQGGVGGGSRPSSTGGSNPPVVPPGRGDGGKLSGGRYAAIRPGDMRDEACRVIADHVRCLTFAITDGAVPDKEGRGYVLRRILRRAVRFGWQYLDLHKPFLCELVDTVVATMGDAFPELRKNPRHVKDVIREEEESFERTLDRGIALFEEAADFAERHHHNRIRGEDAFRLHDTYGFPIDLTQVMAQEKGLTVDIAEYERLMEEARERARACAKGFEAAGIAIPAELLAVFGPTDDSAKYQVEHLGEVVTAIVRCGEGGQPELLGERASLRPGETAGLVFARTCFYAEAGGQVGDKGTIGSPDAPGSMRFDVEATQPVGDVVVHFGTLVMGELRVGDTVELRVDTRRRATMKNHTATHVMNWALREVLGDHVQQKGSLVDHEKTRFDFSHPKALTPEQIDRIERLVNEKIKAALPVDYQVVPQEQALKINGLRAVFGERYPDEVRVMSIGVPVAELLQHPDNPAWRQYSIEFCGGTHLKNTADIEHFVITHEEAVAKGIRRIVATTGPTARLVEETGTALVQQAEQLLGRTATPDRAAPPDRTATLRERSPSPEDVSTGLTELQNALTTATISLRRRARLRELMAELQQVAKEQHKADAADAVEVVKAEIHKLLAVAEKRGDTTIVVGELPDVPVEALKTGADMVKQKCGSAAVLFGVRQAADREKGGAGVPPAKTQPSLSGKALLLAAMTPDLIKKGLKAGDLVKAVAPLVDGGGGGPPTMAQAGGKSPQRLAEALEAGRHWIAERL